MIALLDGIHHRHGRCEVGDIKTTTQIGRELGIADLYADFTPVTFDVYRRFGIGQLDHHTPTAVLATPEVHGLNLRANDWRSTRILGRVCSFTWCRHTAAIAANQQIKCIASHIGVVGHQTSEIDDRPGAVFC